ncbi:hypothetical protein BRC99_04345 [Halobacteriales archaeon QS_7_69_60]|nr:MAG: hypothetical protein BRC99_04345 [Halobacteriales archaeon QS_7_69_60]
MSRLVIAALFGGLPVAGGPRTQTEQDDSGQEFLLSLLQDVPEVLEFVQYLRDGGVTVVDCGPTPPGTVERPSPASTGPDDSAPQG